MPAVIYYRWEHRRRHMDEKRGQMLREAQERYRLKNGGGVQT